MVDNKLNIIFFGTPASVIPFVQEIYLKEKSAGCVTQPPKIAGRGFHLRTAPVGDYAVKSGLKHFQPEKLNEKLFLNALIGLKPDLAVVAAFGRKIPNECMGIPKFGMINIHYSLLPKYRGPAPIQHALLNLEKFTGVTIFFLNEKIDEGPVIMQEKLEITDSDNYITLEEKLTLLGTKMLSKTLDLIKNGKVITSSQDSEASRAPIIKKEDGIINWDKPYYEISAKIKAFIKWPKASFKTASGNNVKVLSARLWADVKDENYKPGEILSVEKDKGFVVKCRDTGLLIERVHPEGKSEMSAWAFWQGAKLNIGDILK